MLFFQIKGNILCFSNFMLFWVYSILTLNIIYQSEVFVSVLKDCLHSMFP